MAKSNSNLGQHLVAYRYGYLLLTVVAVVALALGILRSSFDSSLSAMLSTSDPYLDELDELQKAFPIPTEVNFAFIPKQGSVFQPSVLKAMDDLRTGYQVVPATTRISSLLDYFSPQLQSRLFTKPYDQYSQNELDALGQQAVDDLLLTASLLADNGSVGFAKIVLEEGLVDPDLRIEIANAVSTLRDQLREAHPEVGIHINSEVLFEQYNRESMISDLTGLLPLVILICVLTICYCFRSATLGIAIFSHVGFSIVSTVGLLGVLGIAFNSISVIAPLVVVIIAVANSVHIISILKQRLLVGDNVIEATITSINHNFKPISLAAITTVIGFSSLNMCSSPAIQEFGRIVAFGIVFAYLYTFTLLPVMMIWLLRKGNVGSENSAFLSKTLDYVCSLIETKEGKIFWGFSILAVLTFALLPLNETDFNRLDFVDKNSDLGKYYDQVGDKVNRGAALTYGIDSGSEGGALEPVFLRQVANLTDKLLSEPEIESANSIVDIVKTVNQYQNNMQESNYAIPADIDSVINYLSAYRIIESEDFPLSRFVNEDLSTISLAINTGLLSNQELIDLDFRLGELFSEALPEARLIHGSGLLLFARMDELVTVELLQGYSVSLILITLTLIIGLRSVYFGILSIIPNMLPASIVFGIWALLVGQLDPFVMMLFSISIGLVVDDTVHILSHYLSNRRQGKGKPEAIEVSLKTAGPALTITTMVLALGTIILIFASTLYFQQAAKLLVPIVVLALVLDFLYLPVILNRFDKFSKPAKV